MLKNDCRLFDTDKNALLEGKPGWKDRRGGRLWTEVLIGESRHLERETRISTKDESNWISRYLFTTLRLDGNLQVDVNRYQPYSTV